jgi:hypothetical protein
MLKYTDITQNTYVQSSMVTEILAREKCGLFGVCVLYSVRDVILVVYPTLSLDAAHRSQCIVVGSHLTTMTHVRVFL